MFPLLHVFYYNLIHIVFFEFDQFNMLDALLQLSEHVNLFSEISLQCHTDLISDECLHSFICLLFECFILFMKHLQIMLLLCDPLSEFNYILHQR